METATNQKRSAGFFKNQKITVLGNDVQIKLTGAETNERYFVFDCLISSGQGVPPHTHQLEDEIVTILDGEFEIFIGGKTFMGKKGDVFNFSRNISHGFKNTGAAEGCVLFFVSPSDNFEKFFAELSALPSHQAPDMARVKDIFARHKLPIDE